MTTGGGGVALGLGQPDGRAGRRGQKRINTGLNRPGPSFSALKVADNYSHRHPPGAPGPPVSLQPRKDIATLSSGAFTSVGNRSLAGKLRWPLLLNFHAFVPASPVLPPSGPPPSWRNQPFCQELTMPRLADVFRQVLRL